MCHTLTIYICNVSQPFNMLSILNEFTLKKKLHIVLTNNVYFDKNAHFSDKKFCILTKVEKTTIK